MKIVFSTEVVDLDRQAPNRNKRESKYFWDELYPLIAAGGFKGIEIPYEPKWDFGGRSGIPRTMRSIQLKYETPEAYAEYLKGIGITSVDCVHLDSALFCAGAPEMYLGALGHFAEEAIAFTSGLGCPVLTITTTPPIFAMNNLLSGRADFSEEVFIEKLAEVITSVNQKAIDAGISLCVKNTYWGLFRGERIFDFIEKLPETVKFDIDTSHLSIAGVDPITMIQKAVGRIGIVHFTDTAFVDDQDAYAQPLPEFPAKAATKVFRDIGDGNLDFVSIVVALKEAGYEGAICYNCRNSYDMYRSILRTRSYINRTLIPAGYEG
jgi:inosose dehydratase